MKSRQRIFSIVVGLILFSFSACSGGGTTALPTIASLPAVALLPTVPPFPTVAALPTVPPLPTVAPQATVVEQPTPAVQPPTTAPPAAAPSTAATVAGTDKVLIQDDFSDPTSGWQSQQIDCCQFEYNSGAFRISVSKANFVGFSLFPKLTYDNVSLEADVAESTGPASAIYGLACRVSSTYDKGYIFAIRPDTAHVIFMVSGSGQKELKAVLKSAAILPDKATNHLRADCNGSQLTFYANGQKLIEAQDSQYQSGQVGMVVSTQPDSGGADVSFDNFVAREPPP